MRFQSINPATGQVIAEYEPSRPPIEKTHDAYLSWRKTSFGHRAELFRKAAKNLTDRAEEYARLMTQEMGKPIREARSEIKKCALNCEFYAERAESFLTPETVQTESTRSFVTFQPLGVILAVMPWNFPFWQVFRFAAPALMAGNAALLKHASNVTGCALAIEKIFWDAGFPQDLFRTMVIGSDRVASVIEHPLVRAVTLTGSGPAGRAVAKKAGEMLKKSVLELGGSDPYVVLEDADLESTVSTCVASRLVNTGQSCIAAKRFIVAASVRKPFEALFVNQMRTRKMGDPLKEETDLGPLARHDLRDDLHRQVVSSLEKGAACLLGGKIPEGKGAYYPPTVLTGVKKGMPAYDEELFGPVASIIEVKDEAEAIRVANDSPFGLGAAVFTKDIARGERIAATEIESGNCYVNTLVRSDPRLPFGGIKESGYGRELSIYGIKEFVNVKTVLIQ